MQATAENRIFERDREAPGGIQLVALPITALVREGPAQQQHIAEERFTRRTVTVVMAVIAALAFVFSFGNV
ncbi:hypothetical protein [Streptomyces sp. NPDC058297]|uniref:hypothetical protein n=1 Tax=Streptomyces sp. NPDC058297 TaxID=3346433 RepID=UPI0036EF28A0